MATVHDPASAASAGGAGAPEVVPVESADWRLRDLPDTAYDRTRLVVLEGASNFRDIGGHRTVDGRTVRRGLVFRSDHLHGLTDADLGRVHELGIRTVHDFRVDQERERQPSRFPAPDHPGPAPEVLILATTDAPSVDLSIFQLVTEMLSGQRPMAPESFWTESYAGMLERGRPMFVALFTSLAGTDRLPALYHCSGGKDRTGIATSLLLEVLGVPRDAIMDDFLATNLFRTPAHLTAMGPQLERAGLTEQQLAPVLGVARPALERAWRAVDEDYGGTEQYLVAGGLDPQTFARLRATLLEP